MCTSRAWRTRSLPRARSARSWPTSRMRSSRRPDCREASSRPEERRSVHPPAGCGGFENACSQETAQQFTYGSVQRQDTPNDPNYDSSEPDTKQPAANRTSNFYEEDFDRFGFPSELTHNAVYAVGPHAGKPQVAGFNAAGAWKAERGRADAVVAILDTGIVWDDTELREQIHLNTGELPYPEHSNGSSCENYDCNGDGVVNVDDYAEDPRVSLSYSGRSGPGGLITGQDLIHAFGNCK